MRQRQALCTSRSLLLGGALLLLAAPAQAVEYDGAWQFSFTCAASAGQPAFSDRFTAPIVQNALARTRTNRTTQGAEDISRFTGRIEEGRMTAVLDRNRGGERWSIRFAGPATSETRFEMTGGMFQGERQLRSCQMLAEAQSPAPGSLAATAPARAREALAQVAAARAALATLEARSETEAVALRTDLDLARFESAAMRTELTQRMAATAALETRLRTAEAATAEAQAAQTRALAAAATEIGQRDQALATAATERTALQTRLTAAEAATAQLRSALETAQRELTEARAAQPPR